MNEKLAMKTARTFANAGALGLLSLAACGSSPSPAGQGVASLHLAQLPPTTEVFTCPPGPHWASVPETATSGQQVSATFKGSPAVDGDNGMAVTCGVVPSGDKFVVSANLNSPPAAVGATANTNILLDVTIGAGEDSAAGRVRVFDDKTQAFYDSTNCTFSVKPGDGERLSIAPGFIWGKFTCSKLSDPGATGTGCRVDQGFFTLENCDR